MGKARFKTWTPRVTVTAQGNLLKLSVGIKSQFGGGGPRGQVSEFSNQSRKRMLEMLARVDFHRAGFVSFITLTYPDSDGPPSARRTSRDRNSFCKRLNRRFTEASGLWRREWEERKSGAHATSLYPHFHLLCFNLPFVPYADVNRWWSEVLGTTEYVRTEIKGVRSFRQAMGYVSKYMAKPVASGRRGGTPRCFEPTDSRSLVNVTYLSGEDGGDAGDIPTNSTSIGRSWGAFNRKCIPWAAQESIALPPGFWMDAAKAWATKRYAPIQRYEGHGFTLFSNEAYDGLRKFEAFCKASQTGRYPG